MKKRMFLQLFTEGGAGGNGDPERTGGTGGNGGTNGSYTYQQAEEIATARAERAEKAALRSYFHQLGMSQEEAEQAIKQFKADREKNKPNPTELERERDELKAQLAAEKNSNLLRSKGVRAEDLDYVQFKVEKMVDDKTDFAKAAEKYLKENPRFAGGGYRVTTSTATGSESSAGSKNASINDALRNAMRR